MRVLITGPSCAGKTAFAAALAGDLVHHLDRGCGKPGAQSREVTGAVVFEGLVSDSGADPALVETIDLVLVLEASLVVRLARCLRRDGVAGVPRWLRNEWGWRRFGWRQLRSFRRVRRVVWEPDRGTSLRVDVHAASRKSNSVPRLDR
jgi:hypothetical protein